MTDALFTTEAIIANEFIIDVAGGSVGGFMSKAIDYPFDTAKVLLQTQKKPSTSTASTAAVTKIRHYTGTWDCIQHSIQTNGFTSLYKGIGSRLLGSMVENAVCFLSYASIKRELLRYKQQLEGNDSTKLSYLDLSIAGAGSGAAVSFVMTPVELIKCRLQVSAQLPTPIYRSSWDCLVKTIQRSQRPGSSLLKRLSGGLYQGHMSTMVREVPGNFGWYLTYEIACDAISNSLDIPRDELPVRAHMTAGAIAGVMYWATIFPVDTVKSVLQTQQTDTNSSFKQAFQSIYKEQGIRGLYRGFGATALRAAPANAMLFAGYEQTVQFLKE